MMSCLPTEYKVKCEKMVTDWRKAGKELGKTVKQSDANDQLQCWAVGLS